MTRRKDGLWQQQMTVMVDGRKKQKCFYGRTKAEVLRKIAAYEEEKERGVLFEKVADEWWNEAEPNLSPSTLRGYKAARERAVEAFGKTPIRQIKPSNISRFMSEYVKEKHPAEKTAKNQLMILNLIGKYAVAAGYIDANPARDLSVPKNLKKEKRGMPTDEDLKRVKNSKDIPFGMFAYWALYTGCRRGELLALTWEDVDLEERTISITKSISYEGITPHLKSPKTEAGTRTLPVLDKLKEVISPGKGLIFPGKDGNHMTESEFFCLWGRYAKAAGISCTAHQLRHAFATMLEENNVNEKDAQELLGHAQISTTKDIYTHIREERKKKVRDALFSLDV